MGRHLTACPQRQDQIVSAAAGSPQPLTHVRMQDGYGGPYRLDAEVRGTATLANIDSYLRAIWLECCGHLSRFSLGGWGGQELSDFGTESVTQVKAVGSRRAAPLSRRPIVLMARNLPPDAPCVECGQLASHLCQECQLDWNLPGVLCAQHAKAHPHEEYGEPIEIVNSPRLGLCGYTGPADPPY